MILDQDHLGQELKELELYEKYDGGKYSSELFQQLTHEMVGWLSRLRVLEGVPFRYLVPSEEMLPNESIRFFHIDRNWLDALVDGALSAGRMGSREASFDHGAYTELMNDLHDLERDRRSYSNELFLRTEGAESLGVCGGTLTGFLFRSSVVRDFPGIEISAYDSTTTSNPYQNQYRIPTIRQERLSETVMLCIFNGTPSHVRIQEPYEGIRLGVDTEEARWNNHEPYIINCKDLDANFLCGDSNCGKGVNTADPDPQCVCGQTDSVGFRVQEVFTREYPQDNSVLDIAGIYSHAKSELESINALHAGTGMVAQVEQDSALLAIQMLQFPYQQDFTCYNEYPGSVNSEPSSGDGS